LAQDDFSGTDTGTHPSAWMAALPATAERHKYALHGV